MAFDREICALTIFAEASDQPAECRRAIAHVIFNRMQLDPVRYGHTAAAVCLKRYQFSEWNDDVGDNANLIRAASTPITDGVMMDCLAAYSEALEGGADPSQGATHFYADSIPEPNWAKDATFTVKLGRVLFYKGVR